MKQTLISQDLDFWISRCRLKGRGREVMHNWFMLTDSSHFNTWQYGHRWQFCHKTDKLPKIGSASSELIKTIPFSEFFQSLIIIKASKWGESLKVLLLLYWLWLKPSLSSQGNLVSPSYETFFTLIVFDLPLFEIKSMKTDATGVSYKALYKALLTVTHSYPSWD